MNREAAMDQMTLVGTIEGMRQRGFTDHFKVHGRELVALEAGKAFRADDLLIREYHRFEGVSDPDDMAIVYAIESRSGVRGSLVDAFGVYADPRVSAFLQAVPIRGPHGWAARPDRPVAVPLLHVRLAEQLARLEQEPTWRASGHDAITLVKEPALRLVLMRLGPGAKLVEHKTAGPLVLHVLSGSLVFRAGARTERVGSGELIVLEPGIEHEVQAVADSACLLTLGGPLHPEPESAA
jgi:quercetin dioxygenase-like cupin family protein